ncbi:maltokinase [Streptomyces sp. H10-C2]|uniref:maltokinase N-terminal cap-like domain-containing protein n=1 Tax=unclassified Streptomyces TaxID=2593676 RepID=UPI0024B88B51|nr:MULTISPECIES: maltokinase [unclassified Streptomyces]MDJ0341460.1 maltokinase [Streptomyces sp. PH10-H1]MDJ0369117.1 maltokinase [Streptomyces sp. H10-C2]
MSDSSWTRTSSTTGRSPATAPGLLHSLSPLLLEWLPRQRWFAGKGRPITGFGLVSATELLPVDGRLGTPGLLHLLLDVEQTGRRADCYQLLLGARTLLPASLAPALVGQAVGGPLDGLTIYEGLSDPRLTALLMERLRAPGRTGLLRFITESSTAVPAGLPPRLSTAEQSNTSVVYGDQYILKVFRRVSPGANPDLELSLALARAGSRRVAAPAAWFEAAELPGPADAPAGTAASGTVTEPATLGVLQRYLPDSADGWELALRAIDDGTDFTADARALGAATAEIHDALARALPTTLLDRRRIQSVASSMAQRLDTAAAEVPELRPYRTRLRAAFHDLAELGATGVRVAAQRIHGDLHLGQALRTAAQGWVLIDFEGEPSRPLSDRRLPAPPVQDVAGMLRSFDYAARHRDPAAPAAGGWAERHRDAFCAGYARMSGTDPRDQPVLIRAYETDKAVYEVLYEARHRPAWLPIPMSAIDRLASNPPPRRITP